mmetsp:Transcript_67280/g.196689  ORF Transcript_67280/g.196689 Transcript_67280/m.196689 type:complete len:213 (+) Transcript_67280:64-702(+)
MRGVFPLLRRARTAPDERTEAYFSEDGNWVRERESRSARRWHLITGRSPPRPSTHSSRSSRSSGRTSRLLRLLRSGSSSSKESRVWGSESDYADSIFGESARAGASTDTGKLSTEFTTVCTLRVPSDQDGAGFSRSRSTPLQGHWPSSPSSTDRPRNSGRPRSRDISDHSQSSRGCTTARRDQTAKSPPKVSVPTVQSFWDEVQDLNPRLRD